MSLELFETFRRRLCLAPLPHVSPAVFQRMHCALQDVHIKRSCRFLLRPRVVRVTLASAIAMAMHMLKPSKDRRARRGKHVKKGVPRSPGTAKAFARPNL